jgi:hypothetical protein
VARHRFRGHGPLWGRQEPHLDRTLFSCSSPHSSPFPLSSFRGHDSPECIHSSSLRRPYTRNALYELMIGNITSVIERTLTSMLACSLFMVRLQLSYLDQFPLRVGLLQIVPPNDKLRAQDCLSLDNDHPSECEDNRPVDTKIILKLDRKDMRA